MSARSVRASYPASVEAVREFFTMFYGSEVAQTEDDEERVLFHLGTAGKVVAVTADFLAQFEPVEVREHLAAWNVAHLSRTLERGCRLLVTSDGPEEERD